MHYLNKNSLHFSIFCWALFLMNSRSSAMDNNLVKPEFTIIGYKLDLYPEKKITLTAEDSAGGTATVLHPFDNGNNFFIYKDENDEFQQLSPAQKNELVQYIIEYKKSLK